MLINKVAFLIAKISRIFHIAIDKVLNGVYVV